MSGVGGSRWYPLPKGPGALLKWLITGQEVFDLAQRCPDLDAGDFAFVLSDGHRGVRCLVRSTRIITCMSSSLVRWKQGGHSCLWTVPTRSSFEPHRGEARVGDLSLIGQPAQAIGGHF